MDLASPASAPASSVVEQGDVRTGAYVERRSPNTHKLSGLPLELVDGQPIVPVDSFARGLSLALKRGADIVLSLVGILFLAPLLVIIAIGIKLTSPGPVLFEQDRVGWNGKTFRMMKFRSMFVDQCDASGVTQTTASDPRTTPIGRFIRRTSIDELPQLINVLRGEMSLVGPRPHVRNMLAAGQLYDELVTYYDARHVMRPGLTGWAQVNGFRGPTDTEYSARGRVDHDIAYIQNFSLWLDIVILLLTLKREFITGSGV